MTNNSPNVAAVLAIDVNGCAIQAVYDDFPSGQALAFAAASGASAPIDADSDRVVLLCPTETCWINVGPETPVASVGAGSKRIPGGAMVYQIVPAGSAVAAIQESAAGTLCILPAARG